MKISGQLATLWPLLKIKVASKFLYFLRKNGIFRRKLAKNRAFLGFFEYFYANFE